jgi:hypothetical protein
MSICFLCFADVNQYRTPHLEKEHVDRKVKPAELIRTQYNQYSNRLRAQSPIIDLLILKVETISDLQHQQLAIKVIMRNL